MKVMLVQAQILEVDSKFSFPNPFFEVRVLRFNTLSFKQDEASFEEKSDFFPHEEVSYLAYLHE
jgi:hypothetical protein